MFSRWKLSDLFKCLTKITTLKNILGTLLYLLAAIIGDVHGKINIAKHPFHEIYFQKDGLYFTNGLNWEQIKAKAAREHKYIFLDCFATWCGPCKLMDKNVYSSDTVGRFMNDKFISVKVQMDKSQFDNDPVKEWYITAENLKSSYSITAFPTFLYFSPDGQPIHKAVGYMDSLAFIESARNALNPNERYYTIVNNYQPDKMNTSRLKELALEFQLTDRGMAGRIAADYLKRILLSDFETPLNLEFAGLFSDNKRVQDRVFDYLKNLTTEGLREEKNLRLIFAFRQFPAVEAIIVGQLKRLPQSELYSKESLVLLGMFDDYPDCKDFADQCVNRLLKDGIYNKEYIDFIASFTKSSKSPGFDLFYIRKNMIDSIQSRKGYSKNIIDNIIQKEDIKPISEPLKDRKLDPDWASIRDVIVKKYNADYANRDLLFCQQDFYQYRTRKYDIDWSQYISYTMDLFKLIYNGEDTTVQVSDLGLNNFAYRAILFHCDDEMVIDQVAKWMEKAATKSGSQFSFMVDTYANLLYKLGKNDEGLEWEEKALRIARGNKDESNVKAYSDCIVRMISGRLVWNKKEVK